MTAVEITTCTLIVNEYLNVLNTSGLTFFDNWTIQFTRTGPRDMLRVVTLEDELRRKNSIRNLSLEGAFYPKFSVNPFTNLNIKELIIGFSSTMTDDDYIRIANDFGKNTTLERLQLCRVDPADLIFPKFSTITHLVFLGCCISPKTLESIATYLRTVKTLKRLEFCVTRDLDDPLETFSQALEACITLERISFSMCSLTCIAANRIITAVARLPRCRELRMDYMDIERLTDMTEQALIDNCSLRRLSFTDSKIKYSERLINVMLRNDSVVFYFLNQSHFDEHQLKMIDHLNRTRPTIFFINMHVDAATYSYNPTSSMRHQTLRKSLFHKISLDRYLTTYFNKSDDFVEDEYVSMVGKRHPFLCDFTPKELMTFFDQVKNTEDKTNIKIRELTIVGTDLTTIPFSCFHWIPRLKVLCLNNCNITDARLRSGEIL